MTTIPVPIDEIISLTIPGRPISQGNPQAFTHGGMAYPKSTRNHRNLAIHVLRDTWAPRPRIEGAVAVAVRFMFERPGTHYRPANSKRPTRELHPNAPEHHIQKPDTDKLVRLLFDAATIAGVWADDCRVIQVAAVKTWAEWNGTELHIRVIP